VLQCRWKVGDRQQVAGLRPGYALPSNSRPWRVMHPSAGSVYACPCDLGSLTTSRQCGLQHHQCDRFPLFEMVLPASTVVALDRPV
jgi:hypothetical protein